MTSRLDRRAVAASLRTSVPIGLVIATFAVVSGRLWLAPVVFLLAIGSHAAGEAFRARAGTRRWPLVPVLVIPAVATFLAVVFIG